MKSLKQDFCVKLNFRSGIFRRKNYSWGPVFGFKMAHTGLVNPRPFALGLRVTDMTKENCIQQDIYL